MKQHTIAIFATLICAFTFVNPGYTIPQNLSSKANNTIGPKHGALIIAGGALRDSTVYERFVELAGGKEARIIVIPTAGEDTSFAREGYFQSLSKTFAKFGVPKCIVLHTKDPNEANSPEFYKKIDEASAIWFNGGRQWRLADSFLNTESHRAMLRLLERGGVIGGSSAGATIQGSYLFRGDTKTNTILCGDHEEGLGFISNIAIDQHVLARNRQFDLFEAIEKYPELLGIGIDENTAIEVHANEFKVLGKHYVLVYDGKFYSSDRGGYVETSNGSPPFYFLKPGQRYDMGLRQVIR